VKAPQRASRKVFEGILTLIAILLIAGLILVIPRNLKDLASRPKPAGSYAEAVQRIQARQAGEAGLLNPMCRTQFMTHGDKVAQAIVFVHGYTVCPQQFLALGKEFYDLGYNVLIAPLPHHGLADRMTSEQEHLTAEELAAYADEMVDLARGLGEEVTMAGISAGGVTTAWAAQNRPDLDLAVIISPAFGFSQIPTSLTTVATNLFLTLPNSYQWWDPDLKSAGGPPFAYPRYSTRALAQTMLLGSAVRSAAGRDAPAARAILVITNANDTNVNNALTAQVVDQWRLRGTKGLRTYEFEAGLKLEHDLIDPDKPDHAVELVYPKLIELINQ
jgi:carboxylesterase